MNTFGNLYRLTDFGESHGAAIGGVIDGMPARFPVDTDAIQRCLDRRRPGQSAYTTPRNESDRVTFLSGIFRGRTLGTPIAFTIANSNTRSSDYGAIAHAFRPGHADYTYQVKYGHRDYRGGGRASARETAVRVVGGALALQVLNAQDIYITAYTERIGSVVLDKPADTLDLGIGNIDASAVRCPDAAVSELMEAEIIRARHASDTLGGIVRCIITGVPAGLGEPVFGKLQAMLAGAMMGINAAKGFEYGDGFASAAATGTQQTDNFFTDRAGRVATRTNHSGGIQGGISNGMPITFRVAFKPVATLPQPVDTIDTDKRPATLTVGGRHDVCVVPRAVPIVESMAAMVILDALMLQKARS